MTPPPPVLALGKGALSSSRDTLPRPRGAAAAREAGRAIRSGLGINEGQGSGIPAPRSPVPGPSQVVRPFLAGTAKNMTPLPDTAPLPFFFFRLFFLAASSAVLDVPSSLSSGSRSPFRWLPKDAASSTPAMLPERASDGVRASGEDPLLLHPPPPATPEVVLDGRDAGNAGTTEDSAARGPSARPLVWLGSASALPDASGVPILGHPLRASSGMFQVFKNPKGSDEGRLKDVLTVHIPDDSKTALNSLSQPTRTLSRSWG